MLALHPLDARGQELVDPDLSVTVVASGFNQPIAMAFIGPNDILVTEKATGQVKRVTNGALMGVVLDLAVNSASERGLLGIALHPKFPGTPYVYLYNTESSTGADTAVLANVPLLGNRVDRFRWNGSGLVFDRNIIRLRSYQNDRNNVADPTLPVLRGNHNGGVLRFGPDGMMLRGVEGPNENPWAQPAAARTEWAEGLDIRILQPGDTAPEGLFWVGCAGAFDERARATTKSIARLLSASGVDFAILGPRERCTCDPARRIGNELLFKQIATKNIKLLSKYKVQRILTSYPHCFNTLANDYPESGGRYAVEHHSTFLSRLVAEGKLKPAAAAGRRVTDSVGLKTLSPVK